MKRMSFGPPLGGTCVLVLCLCLPLIPAGAATRYVDSAAKGANNGTSWTDAWTSLAFTGLAAGDTVYISGGASGNTQTYIISGKYQEFTSLPGFTGGTAGNPVTYKIGQDSAHNGTAVFVSAAAGYAQWLFGGSNYILSGDAGDGKMHFQIANYWSGLTLNGSSNIRVSYVNFGAMPTMGSINPGTGIEIDHCLIGVNDLAADHGLFALCTGSAYDLTLFHDNTVYVPYTSGGIGADALQFNGSGYSIYNNIIVGYKAAYTGGQHQDGEQAIGNGSYIKIYGNFFVNLQNYPIYLEPYNGGYAHVRIYNNIMLDTSGTGSQAIAVGGRMSPLRTLDDCLIANNLGDGFAYTFTVRDPLNPTTTGVFSNSYFYNNVVVGGGINIIDGNIISANNVSVTAAEAPAIFAGYIAGSAATDYHIKSTATKLIGTGTNLSAYFGTDKDGTVRVSSGAWDLGPYVGGAGDESLRKPSNLHVVP